MRIGDIEVGKEYAALDNPRPGRYGRRILPRKVRVEEIVIEQKTRFYGFNGREQVNVRRVKVKVIGGIPGGRYDGRISAAADGETLVVEPRNVVQPWTPEIAAEVDSKVALRNLRDETEQALEARIEALGLEHTSVGVRCFDNALYIDLSVDGPDVERVLAALEAQAS